MINGDQGTLSLLELMKKMKEDGKDNFEQAKAWSNYLSKRSIERGVPFSCIFELTPICNLSCKMCYVHLNATQMNGKKLLSSEQWKYLMKQAVENGIVRATLTGGECLTYPDFDEIYLYLLSLGVQTTILTNGVLLNEERINFFEEYTPANIQISLYGSSNEEYERVCGVRCFDTVFANIKKAKEAKLPISIAITPNRFLIDGGKELLRLVHSLGLDYLINHSLFEPRTETGRKNDSDDLDIEEYIQLYTLDAQLKHVCLSSVEPTALPRPAEYAEKSRKGLLCSGGRNTCCITWKGAMQPCLMFQEIQAFPLQEGFQASWNKVHQAVLDYPIPAECESCVYNNSCPVCPIAHARDALPGHASPKICMRTMKLAEVGLIQIKQ